MHTFYANRERGNHIWNQKNKNKKRNVKLNILDEGYPFKMKVLHRNILKKHKMKVLLNCNIEIYIKSSKP